jgi:RND family efflux transporter MFP subunit
MNTPPTNLTEAARVLPSPHISNPPIKLGRVAWLALLVILVAAAAGLIPRWRQRAALRIETADLAIPSVIVTSPAPGKAAAGLALPAEVKPLIEAPIYARANGFLKSWQVDIGAKVEAGQLLAEIDTPELNQELARARAERSQAEAALALSKITAARWVDLLKTSSVSDQEAAEKQSDLTLKTANVEAAVANVRRLEELQSFAHVSAPFSGTITARKTDVGELIAAGSAKELFRLAQTGTLRVYVHVPQSAAHGVVPGQMAEMTMAELPGRRIPAKIVRTSGAMDASSRTLLTELEVDNSAGEILSGSYAEVRFPEAKLDAALTLPSNTLLFRAEGTQVGVVRADGTVELRSLSLGRDFGPTVEVLDGVKLSDQVIVNPSDSLVGGAKVRIGAGSTPAAGAITAEKAVGSK